MHDDVSGIIEVGPSLFSRPKVLNHVVCDHDKYVCLTLLYLFPFQPCNGSKLANGIPAKSGMTNGVEHQASLNDLDLTSADRSRRGESGTPDLAVPMSQPIEAQNVPFELSSTLEHIVGQLDIITQV